MRASAVAGVTCQCQECAGPGNRFTIGTNPRPGYMLADLSGIPGERCCHRLETGLPFTVWQRSTQLGALLPG